MDRNQQADDAATLAELLSEREEWERDQAAVAEYEKWYLQKLIAEADAERISAL